MTPPYSDPSIADLGERLREARLHARLTVREAAQRIGLRTHATLVQYENGRVLPPLDRIAALARTYDVPLASLLVSRPDLAPVVALLEQATASQVRALTTLFTQALGRPSDHNDSL